MQPVHAIDFYKSGHIYQYPKGITRVYSNSTPRRSRREGPNEGIIFFGLQWFILSKLIYWWNTKFFKADIDEICAYYQRRMDNALGKGVVNTEHIRALHKLGYLPICIKALPEGTLVPYRIPAFVVYNTHPDFFWLTNYLETQISSNTWKASTSATTAFLYRKNFEQWYKETVGDPAGQGFIMWQGHDFSARGLGPGEEDQMTTGMAHLLSFYGTDTVLALDAAEEYYFADSDKDILGGSVPATEHSVMCAGTQDGELETFRRLITEIYPSGIVSIVSDTWDFGRVITEYASILKVEILSRTGSPMGIDKVVFRPDTGNPADIICGTAVKLPEGMKLDRGNAYGYMMKHNIPVNKDVVFVEEDETGMQTYYRAWYTAFGNDLKHSADIERIDPLWEHKGAIRCLWDIFGGTLTPKGYKQLNPKVGLIYGDSITLNVQQEILARLAQKGFASTNIVLGIGSFTYNYVTRDTDGWAIKATEIERNMPERGENDEDVELDVQVKMVSKSIPIYKKPKTDKEGTKNSATGLLCITRNEAGELVLHENCSWEEQQGGLLEEVFRDGVLMRTQNFEEIRGIVQSQL